MSSFVVDLITFGCEPPTAELALKWLLACVSPHVMPQASALREFSPTALKIATVCVRALKHFLDTVRLLTEIIDSTEATGFVY